MLLNSVLMMETIYINNKSCHSPISWQKTSYMDEWVIAVVKKGNELVQKHSNVEFYSYDHDFFKKSSIFRCFPAPNFSYDSGCTEETA
jgi:hypothetical protein